MGRELSRSAGSVKGKLFLCFTCISLSFFQVDSKYLCSVQTYNPATENQKEKIPKKGEEAPVNGDKKKRMKRRRLMVRKRVCQVMVMPMHNQKMKSLL